MKQCLFLLPSSVNERKENTLNVSVSPSVGKKTNGEIKNWRCFISYKLPSIELCCMELGHVIVSKKSAWKVVKNSKPIKVRFWIFIGSVSVFPHYHENISKYLRLQLKLFCVTFYWKVTNITQFWIHTDLFHLYYLKFSNFYKQNCLKLQ